MSSSFVYINQNNELEKAVLIDPSITNNIATISTSNVIFGNSTKNANFKFKEVTFENNLNINKNLNMSGNINIIDGLILPNNNKYNSFQGSIYYNDTNHKYYGYYGDTKEWKSLGSGSGGSASSISGELNQNLDIKGNLNVESLNIKSSITLDNKTKLTINDLESVADVEGWSQNGFGENRYWTKYYNFNTTSSMIPNINKILYNEENCVLEWNRNVSQLQFKANLPVNSTSSNLIYPRYVAQTSLTKQTIFEKEEHTPYMIANGLSPGFPFLTPDFQPNHNFSANMNNDKNDILFKADGSIIIDSNINNHNLTYPSIFFKYYVNSSNNVNMYLKTTKKPAKSIIEFELTFSEAGITLDALKNSGAIETARSELKAQFSATFNVPESDIIITFVDGSVIAKVQVSTNQPTQTESTITTDLPTATYPAVLGNLNQSKPITPTTIVKTILSHPKHPLLIEPGFLLTNNSIKTGLSGHIGEIALQMPIKLFTFDTPIDFVNTTGDSKKIRFIENLNNSQIVSYNINSTDNIFQKTNINEISLDIPFEDLENKTKFHQNRTFSLSADSSSFKSDLNALHIESNLDIDKIFQVTSVKDSDNYLTEDLTIENILFSPTTGVNEIPIYHNAQEISLTITFDKKLKTTPYLKIKNEHVDIFYNTPQSNIIGTNILNSWKPKYEFKIPGTNRTIHSNEGDRETINFEIVDGLSSNNIIKNVFDKPCSNQTANMFYVSDDQTAPIIDTVNSQTSNNPKTLIYNLKFKETVSSSQTISGSDLTKNNLDITLNTAGGYVSEMEEEPTIINNNTLSLQKINHDEYKLTLPLSHKYYTQEHSINISPNLNNPIYDKNFNIFNVSKQIALTDNKPARIKSINNLATDNSQFDIIFSEGVCKKDTSSDPDNITKDDIIVEYNNTVTNNTFTVQSTSYNMGIISNDRHTVNNISYIKTHDTGTIIPYRLDIYPNLNAIEDLAGNILLHKTHNDYNILNPPLGNDSIGKYSVNLNIIPHIASITASKTSDGDSETFFKNGDELYITLKISPNIDDEPTSLPTLTFDNNNSFYNNQPSFSFPDTSNSYYTEIEYVYTLKSNIDISALKINDITTTNLKYTNNNISNELNIDDLSAKSPTLDIFTIIPVFTNQTPQRDTVTPTQVNITLDWTTNITANITRSIDANVQIFNITPISQSLTLESSSTIITDFKNKTTTNIILYGLTDGINYSFDIKLTIGDNPYTKTISFDTILPTMTITAKNFSNNVQITSGDTLKSDLVILEFQGNKATNFLTNNIVITKGTAAITTPTLSPDPYTNYKYTMQLVPAANTKDSYSISVIANSFKDAFNNYNNTSVQFGFTVDNEPITVSNFSSSVSGTIITLTFVTSKPTTTFSTGNINDIITVNPSNSATYVTGSYNSSDNITHNIQFNAPNGGDFSFSVAQDKIFDSLGNGNVAYTTSPNISVANPKRKIKIRVAVQRTGQSYKGIGKYVIATTYANKYVGNYPLWDNDYSSWKVYWNNDDKDEWLDSSEVWWAEPHPQASPGQDDYYIYSSGYLGENSRLGTPTPAHLTGDFLKPKIRLKLVTSAPHYGKYEMYLVHNNTEHRAFYFDSNGSRTWTSGGTGNNEPYGYLGWVGIGYDQGYTNSETLFDILFETHETHWENVANILFNPTYGNPINVTHTGSASRVYNEYWALENNPSYTGGYAGWKSPTHSEHKEYIMLDFEFKFAAGSGRQYLMNIGGGWKSACPQWIIVFDTNTHWFNTPGGRIVVSNNCITAGHQSWVDDESHEGLNAGIAQGPYRGQKPGVGIRSNKVLQPGNTYYIKVIWEAFLPSGYTSSNSYNADQARYEPGIETTEIYLYIKEPGSVNYTLDTFTDNYAQNWSYHLGAGYPPPRGYGGTDGARDGVGLSSGSASDQKFIGIGGNPGWSKGLLGGTEIKITDFKKIKKQNHINITVGDVYK